MRYGWSLDRSTWSERVACTHASAGAYVPSLSPLSRSHVPERSRHLRDLHTRHACLPRSLLGKLYNAVDVGQAIDLRQRFLAHARSPGRELQRAHNAFQVLDFYFMTASLEDLNQLEALLIECLGPSANQRAGIAARIGEPIAL